MCFTKDHILDYLYAMLLSTNIMRKDGSNEFFTAFDHFDNLSYCFEIISIGVDNEIGLSILGILKITSYRHFCVFICFWLVLILVYTCYGRCHPNMAFLSLLLIRLLHYTGEVYWKPSKLVWGLCGYGSRYMLWAHNIVVQYVWLTTGYWTKLLPHTKLAVVPLLSDIA